jgi:hypothetical protein
MGDPRSTDSSSEFTYFVSVGCTIVHIHSLICPAKVSLMLLVMRPHSSHAYSHHCIASGSIVSKDFEDQRRYAQDGFQTAKGVTYQADPGMLSQDHRL